MGIAMERTHLPLDVWAWYMAIPGWLFNQVTHPQRPKRGACDLTWLQDAYSSDPNRIVGREDLARAIAAAEREIAGYLGYYPWPTYVRAERHRWEQEKRGRRNTIPYFQTDWGYLISAGLETWTSESAGVAIVYSDRDGDGVNDWATITFNTTLTDPCEIEVVPPGRDPTEREWRIRPLEILIDTALGTCTIQGYRWLFVDPDIWLTINNEPLDGANFLATVDVYRHHTVSTARQAQYVWRDPCGGNPCVDTCQDACITIINARNGIFYAQPATYASGAWASAAWTYSEYPDHLQIWYLAGYQDHSSYGCDWMTPSMKEAIVRLANVYLVHPPCGCSYTHEKWASDREEMAIDNITIDMAKTAFGTTARGAVFAYSVFSRLEPLGRGR